jgi:tRNA(Arg) A34 adenosine deaminase TadA
MKHNYKNKFMDICFDLAKINDRVAGARVAAALVYRNREIISIKTNVLKTHPFQAKFSTNPKACFLHAENHVILSALKSRDISTSDLEDCALYICRASQTNYKYKNMFYKNIAKPCPGCMRTIIEFNIPAVFYSISNDNFGTFLEGINK